MKITLVELFIVLMCVAAVIYLNTPAKPAQTTTSKPVVNTVTNNEVSTITNLDPGLDLACQRLAVAEFRGKITFTNLTAQQIWDVVHGIK